MTKKTMLILLKTYQKRFRCDNVGCAKSGIEDECGPACKNYCMPYWDFCMPWEELRPDPRTILKAYKFMHDKCHERNVSGVYKWANKWHYNYIWFDENNKKITLSETTGFDTAEDAVIAAYEHALSLKLIDRWDYAQVHRRCPVQ